MNSSPSTSNPDSGPASDPRRCDGPAVELPATQVSFSCDTGAARDAVRRACEFLAAHRASGEDLRSWELLLTEACTNAVQHTPADRRAQDLDLLLIVHASEIEAQVVDHTQGFDLPPCLDLPEDLEEGGRGLYVIRSLAGHMEYLRGPGSNRLRVTRRRDLPTEMVRPPSSATPTRDGLTSALVEHDLRMARSIQQTLLPRHIPQPSGGTLAGRCVSAREVGGDFFDVLRWDDQGLLLVMADVMGKGMPAALVAGMLRSHIHALQEWAIRPGDFLAKINQRLHPDLDAVEMFVTAQLVFLEPAQRRGRLASAGHGPMLVFGEDGVREVNAEGLPLGVRTDVAYGQTEFAWGGQGGLLLHTDGITESRAADGTFFGLGRLKSWCREAAARPARGAEQWVAELEETLGAFQGGTPPRDDQTFLLLVNRPVAA